MSKTVPVKIKRKDVSYEVAIGRSTFAQTAEWVTRSLGRLPRKAVIVSNTKVFGLYGESVLRSLKRAGIDAPVHLIGDGERFKSFRTLLATLRTFGVEAVDRGDAVISLGGGVVGDLAGFAAATHLRGIDLLQIPTTLLSMIDSSVGGKTAVNTEFGKNLAGAFFQPRGVFIDIACLATLPKREITAGFCEAIKQGALSGRKLLDLTDSVLRVGNGRKGLKGVLASDALSAEFESFLAAQIAFKAGIVRGDEGESTSKTDARSRKILNFGHTFAHALENVTDYRYLKHGEAVGHGIIFAAELSKNLELLPPHELKLLNDVVHRAGMLPPIHGIDPARVSNTFRHDKKVIGNDLQWVLLNGIGNPKIVAGREIPSKTIGSVLKRVLSGKNLT